MNAPDEIVTLAFATGPARKIRRMLTSLGLPERRIDGRSRKPTLQVFASDQISYMQWDSAIREFTDD